MRWIALCVVTACAAEPGGAPTAPSLPEPVVLDPGPTVTSSDLATWDATFGDDQTSLWRGLCETLSWVTPALAHDASCSPVITKAPTAAYHDEWDVHDWAIAVATMYELSLDPKYLDELGQLDDVLVAARGAYDPTRGRTYAGWVIDRGCKWGSFDVTGLFAGMLARYARIVTEHADQLGPAYTARAERYATAASLALADIPADERSEDATHLLYLVTPGAKPACTAQITSPGLPYPYNMHHLMMGAMVDLVVARARGLDTQGLGPLVAEAQQDLPRLWTQWRDDAVRATPGASGSDVEFERWPSGLSPDGKARIEDSSHAAVTIELLTRVERQLPWIEPLVPCGLDATTSLDDGLANTLVDVATAQDGGTWEFPGDMDGTANETVYSRAQRSCAGWALVAPHSAQAYARCEAVTLAEIAGDQPNLTAGDVAALLWMKPMAP
jgi:hypothetical protein|nr:hypothetical protein [Kofleriaceae bacterium]